MIYRSNDTSDRFENTSACQLSWNHLPSIGNDGMVVGIALPSTNNTPKVMELSSYPTLYTLAGQCPCTELALSFLSCVCTLPAGQLPAEKPLSSMEQWRPACLSSLHTVTGHERSSCKLRVLLNIDEIIWLINSYKPYNRRKCLDVIKTRIAHHCCHGGYSYILQPLTEKKNLHGCKITFCSDLHGNEASQP